MADHSRPTKLPVVVEVTPESGPAADNRAVAPLEDLAALDHGAAASLRIRPPFLSGDVGEQLQVVEGVAGDRRRRSGQAPDADPVLPPSSSAATTVAERSAAIGVIPWRTM